MSPITRRRFNSTCAAAAAVGLASPLLGEDSASSAKPPFAFKYLLGSSLYGYQSLEDIIPEVRKTGATAIDIWPMVHGNQREQLDEMGEAKFAEMLKQADIQLGCITQYKLGPFGLRDEFALASRFGCPTIVSGGAGPKGLTGSELKAAVGQFIEKLKPHLEIAEASGVTLAIENHANNLIESPDSLKWLAEMRPSSALGIAFAPYHLPQQAEELGQLVGDLGESIEVFYAWQHGQGSVKKLPKAEEMEQLPGLGSLDFQPMVQALKKMNFQGWMEIFMHPVPRGVPILEKTSEVTEAVNKSRGYLEGLL
ncbi:Xylose isomerase-like TIM barrel [Roseimaritima multifibrata]|uniref:Xylose isomerase-like TIM barrel n=1 Tax=Roseimaritima multifibrata TaxID=1930274 RepID=A0A517MFR9_9BACT|nr:TIM barrel protein [Roseimaritima multifibrata]QDS93735.1 Xylose isomerase-like TIM barrel [Roseimaritima multifibrata]